MSKSNYHLHEFDPVKIVTGEIDPYAVESAKFEPYTRNAKGTSVIDKNADLTYGRTLISLQTSKSTQTKFNQVVSIEFEEFVEPTNNATAFLKAKLETLEKSKSLLTAQADRKDSKIAQLEDEIEGLKTAISEGTYNIAPEPNNVPDTLFANKLLYADRTGKQGAPFAPKIQDRLLSINRTAIARIQQDGNFIIETGQFDSDGQPIEGTTPEIKTAFGWNQKNNSVSAVHLYAPNTDNGQLEIVRLSPWEVAWGSGRQKLGNDARLVLDDSGVLTLYAGENPRWSSYSI